MTLTNTKSKVSLVNEVTLTVAYVMFGWYYINYSVIFISLTVTVVLHDLYLLKPLTHHTKLINFVLFLVEIVVRFP